jgi:hypothetical protein
MAKKEQIKFNIETDIVSAFRNRCAKVDASMTSVVRQWMITGKPMKNVKIDMSSRTHRKKSVDYLKGMLEDALSNEENYRDNIPEQFQTRYDMSDNTCEQLAQAISSLEDAY